MLNAEAEKGEVGHVGTKYTVASVDAAVAVITFLTEQDADGYGFGVSHIARQLGLSKATCYNILQTLVQRSWLEFAPRTRTYRLGPGLIQLGFVAHRQHQVLRIFREQAEPFCAESGWACILTQLTPQGEIVTVDKIESRHPIKVTVIIGQRFHLSAAALGRTFLAFLPEDEARRIWPQDPLPRFTPASVTSQADLVRAVQEVRRLGYGTSRGEYYEGENAVAAPVFDAAGHIAYVICTLAFSSDLTEEEIPRYGSKIVELARRITLSSGGQWPLSIGAPPPIVPVNETG